MNLKDIEKIIQKAHKELVTLDYPGHLGQIDPWTRRLLERFATLVVASKREACAKVCEEIDAWNMDDPANSQKCAGCARKGGNTSEG